jgi:hypothetical protein
VETPYHASRIRRVKFFRQPNNQWDGGRVVADDAHVIWLHGIEADQAWAPRISIRPPPDHGPESAPPNPVTT